MAVDRASAGKRCSQGGAGGDDEVASLGLTPGAASGARVFATRLA